jgi:DNA-binding NtrC family response regulator
LGWRIGAALLELGDSEGSRPWIDRSLVVAQKAGERKEQALALRARGLWHARAGSEAEARRDMEEALGALEALRVPFEVARAHLTFETILLECASDSRAVREERRRHAGAARRIFERIGALHMLRQAEAAEHRLTEEGAAAPSRTSGSRRGAKLLEAEWASPSFRATLHECRKLGPTSLPILLLGETGTGKSLLAEALHDLGRSADGDFFPVNCAALPEHLQESELFGHRKGAFTGAEREHPGIFREAARGTVFLDEIDKTTLEFQAKLLHVLDSREVRPVGSTRPVTVEARILCATNRNLDALVADGRFLDDLHHRLLGGAIEIPPLRDRSDDLPRLVGVVLEEICALERTSRPELDDEAWQVLKSHTWPGNVRELKTLLHRAIALNRGVSPLTAELIISSAPAGSTLRGKENRAVPASGLTHRMATAERDEILQALESAKGVRRRAAEILGVSYRGLGKKMVRLGIERRRRAGRSE